MALAARDKKQTSKQTMHTHTNEQTNKKLKPKSLLRILFHILNCKGLCGTARHKAISITRLKLLPEKVTELGKMERRIPLGS